MAVGTVLPEGISFDTFRLRLTGLIDAHGYTRREFSRIISLDPTTLSKILTGKRDPDLIYVVRTAQLFNCSVEWLLGLDTNGQKIFDENVPYYRPMMIAELYARAEEDDRKDILRRYIYPARDKVMKSVFSES